MRKAWKCHSKGCEHTATLRPVALIFPAGMRRLPHRCARAEFGFGLCRDHAREFPICDFVTPDAMQAFRHILAVMGKADPDPVPGLEWVDYEHNPELDKGMMPKVLQ